MSRFALLVAVLAISLLMPHSARAQSSSAPGARFTLLFETGFGGELHIDQDPGPDGEADLDPTVGVGARLAFPVGRHLLIGGHADLLGVETDLGTDRELVLTFDMYVAFRHMANIANKPVEFFIGVPLGLAVMVFDDDFGDDDDAWPGLNIGALGGAQMFFGNFGLLAEAGVRHISVFNERRDRDLHLGATQFFLQVGGSVVF